ncbi:MAG: MerR family transcriptional regulator [Bacteroidales bacterium]|jgi:DNA-binding transcriptional MerR regulator|nr:MerR family transcriptional regulator [Bacteroidales bacterium]
MLVKNKTMEQYTLNDLEKLTGIRADTIRIWEYRYSIVTPRRTETNRRWYTGDDLRKLINISILNRYGTRISEIATLPVDILESRTEELVKGKNDPGLFTDSLVKAITEYNEEAVNEILLRASIKLGFEKTFTNVVFPFLKKVGVLWHTGSVNIGSEHFISNIFRQRLIAAIDSLTPSKSGNGMKLLMFLPENEYHELGLLWYAYIAQSLGNRVIYLGQSTPLSAVAEVSTSWKPEMIITGTLSGKPLDDPDKFVRDLKASFPESRILLSGFLADVAEKTGLVEVHPCRSETELRKHLGNRK